MLITDDLSAEIATLCIEGGGGGRARLSFICAGGYEGRRRSSDWRATTSVKNSVGTIIITTWRGMQKKRHFFSIDRLLSAPESITAGSFA